jgi:hypothetical protein
VPYSIDGPISRIGRQQITTAMTTWSNVAPVRFVERTNEADFITFNVRNDECFSMVGRVGGGQLVGCEFPIVPVVAAGSRLAFERQGDRGQVDCVFVGTDGAVYVMWTVAPAVWANPVRLTAPNIAPPGAPVALHHQGGPNQLDAVFVDNRGVVNVMWVIDAGPWQGPVGLTPPNSAPPGAPVALHHQIGPQQLDAVFVDGHGAVNVMWVVGGGAWQGPVGLTPPNTAPPGASVALEHQTGPQQLDAVFVGRDGAVNVMWVIDAGVWQGPVGLTPPNAAPPGAPVALHHQIGPRQLDAVFVDGNGAVNVMWVIDGGVWQGPVGHYQGGAQQLDAVFVDNNGVVNVMWVIDGGAWQGPVGLTPANTAPPGAPVALHHQSSSRQLDALFVDGRGVVNVMWVIDGGTWQGPAGLTPPNTAPPGAPVALHHQARSRQLDALFVDGQGAVNVMWVIDGGVWQGPVGLTPPNTAPPGAPVALHHQVGPDQLDALFVGTNGVVSVMWAIGGGAWQGPVGLTGANAAPPGAPVALHHQASTNQLDALFVDGNGVVNVMWAVGGGVWQGPVAIS